MATGRIENLRTPSTEEAREIGRKGGIASGKARKERKTMKALLKEMLEETATKDGKSYMELATLGLIKGAVKGDSRNYKVMLETLGEMGEARQEELNKLDDILSEIKKDAK